MKQVVSEKQWKNTMRIMAAFVLGIAAYAVLQASFAHAAKAATVTTQGGKLFTAADPSIIYTNGQYYGTYVSSGSVYVRKAATVAGLASATAVKIWANTAGVSEVWAPEIVKYKGMYYVYFSYGAGSAHRMYVISSANPDSGYSAPKKVALPDDKWAVDGTLFVYNNETWFVWSGWAGNTNGRQDIYVARMSDPATATGPRYLIASPTESWEKKAGGSFGLPYVIEAPEPVLDPSGQLHLGVSVNGYWSTTYCTADMRLRAGGDVSNINDWFKSNGCLLGSSAVMANVGTVTKTVNGPGHPTFILPDGDISQSPTAGTVQFAYAGVPSTSLYLPNTGRAWYWGNKTWLSNVTYTRTTPTVATDTGWTPKYYE